MSLPNYIRKFLYLLHDQIDLVPSTNPSPNGVKSTRVTIKRPFRAWAIVTAQYSWRGTWYPPSPLKSRIQRRSTMNSIKWTDTKEVQWPPVSKEGDAFAFFHRWIVIQKRREFVRYLFRTPLLYPGNHWPELCSLSMLEIRFSQKDTPETAFTTSLAAEIKKVSSGIQSASLDISYFWDISRAGNSVEGSLFAMMMVIMMME